MSAPNPNQDEAPNPGQGPIATPFPNPPAYYRSFTATNLAALQEWQAEHEDRDSAIPEHLRDLRPPTPPGEGEAFFVFGEERRLQPSPSPRVPHATTDPPAPSPHLLQQTTRALLLAYLALLDGLVRDPAGAAYGPRWERLRDLFQTAHGIVNGLRGWQGREALIQTLESMLETGRKEEADWARMEAQTRALVQGVGEQASAAASSRESADTAPAQGTEREGEGAQRARGGTTRDDESEGRRMWRLLEELEVR